MLCIFVMFLYSTCTPCTPCTPCTLCTLCAHSSTLAVQCCISGVRPDFQVSFIALICLLLALKYSQELYEKHFRRDAGRSFVSVHRVHSVHRECTVCTVCTHRKIADVYCSSCMSAQCGTVRKGACVQCRTCALWRHAHACTRGTLAAAVPAAAARHFGGMRARQLQVRLKVCAPCAYFHGGGGGERAQ